VGRAVALAVVAAAIAVAVGVARARRGADDGARCGPGFRGAGARCVPADPARCPRPLVVSVAGVCEAPDTAVWVPAASLTIGPADWEATGRVKERTLRTRAFRLDAFEVTLSRWLGQNGFDPARAASGMTSDEAEAFCERRGGRLPTEDEWTVAAAWAGAGGAARRYPWGDTGAVCRRAAWGLSVGPCATGAEGPDTVGAHPDGDSSAGLHDLAGNVAEWVSTPASASLGGHESLRAVAKGGSWKSSLASELRVWARLELSPGARDPSVGFRCAYDP
jgi:formylglycine-generating enzyme